MSRAVRKIYHRSPAHWGQPGADPSWFKSSIWRAAPNPVTCSRRSLAARAVFGGGVGERIDFSEGGFLRVQTGHTAPLCISSNFTLLGNLSVRVIAPTRRLLLESTFWIFTRRCVCERIVAVRREWRRPPGIHGGNQRTRSAINVCGLKVQWRARGQTSASSTEPLVVVIFPASSSSALIFVNCCTFISMYYHLWILSPRSEGRCPEENFHQVDECGSAASKATIRLSSRLRPRCP